MQPVDILILSNGPGELATWVRPVVSALRQQWSEARSQLRISVVLSPCPHATGKEAAIARSYPEIDRVQAPEHFSNFLLWGKTAENWEWRDKGVVLFLGGDQFFTLAIARRLKYRTVVYAEWEARWQTWIHRFAVMKPELVPHNHKYAHKFTVVGDLIAEVVRTGVPQGDRSRTAIQEGQSPTNAELIGLLPGSKPAKLSQGVPLCLAIAERIQQKRPQTRFIIPVAPTLDLQTLARFADPQHNPVIKLVGGTSAQLVIPEAQGGKNPTLMTANGLQVELWTQTPAYDLLSQCSLCLTTVGANTAELGSLAVPMIVLLPTQQLDAMRAWDGLPGLLANLPVLGAGFAKVINALVLRQGKRFAWPNIWAGEQIVPEIVGNLRPKTIAEMVIDLLQHPEKLQQMRDRLRAVRGEPGASEKIARIVWEELERSQVSFAFSIQNPK